MSEVMAWASVFFWGLAASLIVIRLIYKKVDFSRIALTNNTIVKEYYYTSNITDIVKTVYKYLYNYHLDIAFAGLVTAFIHTVLEFRPHHFNETGYALWVLIAVLFISGIFMKKNSKVLMFHRIATFVMALIGIVHVLEPWFSISYIF